MFLRTHFKRFFPLTVGLHPQLRQHSGRHLQVGGQPLTDLLAMCAESRVVGVAAFPHSRREFLFSCHVVARSAHARTKTYLLPRVDRIMNYEMGIDTGRS